MSELVNSVRIRRAQYSDLEGIWSLVASFAVSYAPQRQHFDATFGAVIDHRSMLAACATDGGRVIGYLLANQHPTFFANGPVAWVEELMVDEDHRGCGVGRKLMRYAEVWAQEAGAVYIALATRRAVGFYTRLDYEESATFFRKQLGM